MSTVIRGRPVSRKIILSSVVVLCIVLLAIGIAVYFATRGQSDTDSDKITEVENGLISSSNKTPTNIIERMAYYHVQGLSMAVIKNYQIIWAKGYGWADTIQKRPVTASTLFQAASISKSINSVGLLRLAQEKKLDLYANINDYLTRWKFPYDSLSGGKNISVAHLLSHTAGLTVSGFYGYENGKKLPSIEKILDGLPPANSAPVRSAFEPGLRFEYSGGGTTISHLVAMDITKRAYQDFMEEQVLTPLGMSSSTFAQPPTSKDPDLLSTAYYENGTEIPGKYHIYPEMAAAGLWTTPTDLARYVIETQLSYDGRSSKVLDQESTKVRLTPYANPTVALGVFIDTLDGVAYFRHNGGNAGFRSQYYGSLTGGNGVVVMVNSDSFDIIPEIVNSVAKVYGFKGLDRSEAE